MISRDLFGTIKNQLFKGKAIILMGPRQAGKTTLVNIIKDSLTDRVLWLNGDESNVREALSNTGLSQLRSIIGNYKVLVIDEAQRIENIGITIKLIVDNLSEVQVIATGSSSFELANRINEPLTGRKYEHLLLPLSHQELQNHFGYLEEKGMLHHRLIFGSYPEVVTHPGEEEQILKSLSGSYLFKDIFTWENIKKPDRLEQMVKALAFQTGNQVSYHELGQLTGLDNETVEKYILLLERAFVIFRLNSFSRNLRNELKRSRKIYFYDNGIRNALINNFNQVEFRNDIGQLWENYLISERMKRNLYRIHYCNVYFWRNHNQQEIDYLEEYGGKIHAYEFKWNAKRKVNIPNSFAEAYPEHEWLVIHPENYLYFLS
ncbi:MAG TPA: ATP-binding protein [Prolixibacteraceae bacterium]